MRDIQDPHLPCPCGRRLQPMIWVGFMIRNILTVFLVSKDRRFLNLKKIKKCLTLLKKVCDLWKFENVSLSNRKVILILFHERFILTVRFRKIMFCNSYIYSSFAFFGTRMIVFKSWLRFIPKSLKQVLKVPSTTAWKQYWMTRVLRGMS